MSILKKIFGDANERSIRTFNPLVERINALEEKFTALSTEELKQQTLKFRERLAKGETLDDLLPEAFAAVRVAAQRTINQRHFDVQLIGGMVLHQGKIAEMRTGEGKTLTATLAVYLNAITGNGVHVVTVNDYLSRRDAVWMGQIYDALGVTVGVINHDSSYLYDAQARNKGEEQLDEERDSTGSFHVVHEFLRTVTRREAYLADVTYGTNNEFGFDYLRDNLALSLEQKAQAKGHNFAIVDEVDSILIDEARTPLIISMPDAESTKLYETFSKIAPRLVEGEDYNIDEKLKAASITEKGIEKVEQALGIKDIYAEGGMRQVHHMEQALRAQVLFKRDRDYVVKNGEVIIVDEFTGRLMPGRRWSDGLHQAIEAKEGATVQKESRTLATITFQNYFRLYKKLAGMTGTAATSAEEFFKVYKLEVVVVPPNKPPRRADIPDRIYKNEEGKFRAIVAEVKRRHFGESDEGSRKGDEEHRQQSRHGDVRHRGGQPVLIGTVSIEKNELLAAMLAREGVAHKVLNAKNHEQEAEIIAQAGRLGAVTVATNMAGRGVDIILGGNPPSAEEAEKVCAAGGLHVLGTERHEARRIDNQLRGRAGRQGDPGSSQFFVSTQDDVIRVFGGDRLHSVMETLGVKDDEVIENRMISRAIEQAQSRIEGHNFDARHQILEYDDVMNRHRTAVYKERDAILASADEKQRVQSYIHETIERFTSAYLGEVEAGNAEIIKEIEHNFRALTGFTGELQIQENSQGNELINYLTALALKVYDEKEKQIGSESMRLFEKMLMVRVIDELWVDHLENMEYLRDSVRLRAYGQRDPLVEYKVEGQKMFIQLMNNIMFQSANYLFKFQPQSAPTQSNKKIVESRSEENTISEKASPVVGGEETGRNDPCPCGAINPKTGRVYKYKNCGLINAPHHKG